jgi:hypothetical protein
MVGTKTSRVSSNRADHFAGKPALCAERGDGAGKGESLVA